MTSHLKIGRRGLHVVVGFLIGIALLAIGLAIAAIINYTTATNQFGTADFFGDIEVGNAETVQLWAPAAVAALPDNPVVSGCLVISAEASSTGAEDVRLYATALAGNTAEFDLSASVKTDAVFIGSEGAYQSDCSSALGATYDGAGAALNLIPGGTLLSALPTTYATADVVGSSDGTDDAWALQLNVSAATGAPSSSAADLGFIVERQNPAP